MVNNSTNINKANTCLRNSLNMEKITTYDNGNPGFDLGQAQQYGMYCREF